MSVCDKHATADCPLCPLEKRIEALEKEIESPNLVRTGQLAKKESGTILDVLYKVHYDDIGLYEAEIQIRQLAIEKAKTAKGFIYQETMDNVIKALESL